MNKTIVLGLNRHWQAINIRTPADAFCQMATNAAPALDLELGIGPERKHSDPLLGTRGLRCPFVTATTPCAPCPKRSVPTVIVAVNYARVPKQRPKNIRERDGNRCQYTGRLLHPHEGSLDHVVPRSRGGQDAWENLVWSAKDVNQRKADRLPHEAGLKLLKFPRAPQELPVTALIHNAPGIADWELFLG